MNIEAKKQYMEILRKRYFKACKKEKGEILNEYCRNTKQERKYVIKKFNYKVKLKTKENKKKRTRFYDGRVKFRRKNYRPWDGELFLKQ